MKIVFDTNVILSSFITQGLSYRVLDLCLDKHRLYISQWIIDEISGKLKRKFKIPDNEIKRVQEFISRAFVIINPDGEIPILCRDKDDNNILHLAKFIKADIIITGDKDLLDLKKFNKVKIINPRTYMEKYNKIH